MGFTCMPLCSSLRVLSHSGPWVPAGTRSSLRPLHRGGSRKQQNSGAKCRENADLCVIEPKKMVLPDRIELSTSPLPMECSTTELRQQCWDKNRPPQGPTKRADICHRPPRCASLHDQLKRENRGDIGGITAVFARNDRLSADFGSDVPHQLASWLMRRIRPILSFARSGPSEPLELPHSPGMLPASAVLDP